MKIFRKLEYGAAAVVLACAAFLLVGNPAASTVASVGNELAAAAPVSEIEGYRNWTKANSEPVQMAPVVAKLCFIQKAPSGVEIYGDSNPHQEKFITVYVNDAGRRAMLSQKRPKFPVGSVIVKEKLPAIDSQSPELLTVMIKQRKGFNPAGGDWEYMVLDGTGTKIEGRGRLENCQACHLANQKTDYVFRSYLDREVE
ncbi:MAG TPA: cytochrome P460 family protein, partial [Pyrinomonadaceae bacterium]|nr:cytochrome P460 family protein [Pyrinomonadaceae bacterium]